MTERQEHEPSIEDRVDHAMVNGFMQAVRRHRRYDLPLLLWEDEAVVYVDAHEIALPEDMEEP